MSNVRIEDPGGEDGTVYECPHTPQHDVHQHWADEDPSCAPGVEWDEYDCRPECAGHA